MMPGEKLKDLDQKRKNHKWTPQYQKNNIYNFWGGKQKIDNES